MSSFPAASAIYPGDKWAYRRVMARRWGVRVKLPGGLEVRSELAVFQVGAQHLDGHGALVERIFGLEAYVVDEELDALLRDPLAQVEVHGEDDTGGAVHAPDECADALFGGAFETLVVEEHLPPECVALTPEGR